MQKLNPSHIQNLILTKLLSALEVKYSDAHPDGIDNDLYNYHLKELVKKGFVLKSDDKKYSLTSKGRNYVMDLDSLGKPASKFKVSVILYVIREVDGKREILVCRRKRHPYYGDVTTLSGKIQLGEAVETAAARKLYEETGLKAEFRFVGVIRKTRYLQVKLIEDTLYHYCYTENATGDLKAESEFGEFFWTDIDTAIEYEKANMATGPFSQKAKIDMAKYKKFDPFYYHETVKLKSI